jgi:hypothetical protein
VEKIKGYSVYAGVFYGIDITDWVKSGEYKFFETLHMQYSK